MSLIEGFNIFKNGVDNWFELAIDMFIFKKGGVDCSIKNIGTFKTKKGKNYLKCPLFRALVFSNTKELDNEQTEILKTYLDQIEDDEISIINREDGKTFKFLNREISIIFESFLYGDYKDVPPSDGEYLIDIGANVGDTAIYFANKGYEVIALEPLPHIYEIAKENINLNPELKDKIILSNKACSCKKGEITINYNEADTGGASEFSKNVSKVQVEAVTIDDIIKKCGINPAVLKLDCEGCEANIIKHSDLSMFKEIIFEYHTKVTSVDENDLVDILEKQGFKLEKQKRFKNNDVGIIYMVK